MTVKELTKQLAKYPPEMEIYYPDTQAVQPYRITKVVEVTLVKGLTFILVG